tara:strand:+ start:104 stop:628 length:525 start_codon:yes stop_codon:yes gene_type:complete
MFNRYKNIFLLVFSINFIFSDSEEALSKTPNLKIRLIDGSDISLNEFYKDGPLLIDFWATWCVPCKKLMKYLNQYHQEYRNEGFKVLMINTDSPRSIGKVKSYIKSQNYKFLVGVDPNKVISKKLNSIVMPTTILINQSGDIVWRHQGYIKGEEIQIKRKIESLLNKKHGEQTN